MWAGACDSGGSGSSGGRGGQAAAAAAAAASAVAAAAAAEGGLEGGALAIEIPGQYHPLKSDCRPCAELHAKLLKFSSKVDIVRRDGQLCRRLTMNGSDGEAHHFLLHFTIPYVTTSDQRAIQIRQFLNQLLKRNVEACRRHLKFQTTAVVPLSQRMRMTGDSPMNTTLGNVWELDRLQRKGRGETVLGPEEISSLFSKLVAESVEAGESSEGARLIAYRRICRDHVRDDVLLRHMTLKLDGLEALWSFKRTFSVQLALDCALHYAFACAGKTPNGIVFNCSNGKVLSTNFRPEYSNSGLLETKAGGVPFRLTRNLTKLLGSLILQGCFVPALTTVSSCVALDPETLECTRSMLRVVLLDDIVSWHGSKSPGKADGEGRKLEGQLMGRVDSNVDLVVSRLKEMSGSGYGVNCDEREVTEINFGVVDEKAASVVDSAKDERFLCMVDAKLHPWL